jgi:glycolate oxidase FAD binding subunit
MTTYRPTDEKQTAEAVAWAAGASQSFEIVAGASKRALGRPAKADHVLDVSGLSGIVDYEAAELVLTARPATPLAVIERELAARRQMLAFEPPDWRMLLGSGGEPTLGGALACNLAGPRRVRAGAPRDFFLGFAAVNGFGDVWKAGGKVVKNVTGYDLMKLQAGAFGTLSVLTEATVKVMPRPETERTILLPALADDVAVQTMSRALNTPFEVSAAAHLPHPAASRSRVEAASKCLGAVTAIRLEGPEPSVAYRTQALEEIFGRGAHVDGATSAQFWKEVGDVRPLLPAGAPIIWRVCPTPSLAADVVAEICASFQSAQAFFDWGGGLIWLSLDEDEAGPDAGAQAARDAVKRAGGHATLIVAPDSVREKTPVFEPLEGALAALTSRIKANFDPKGVLNPGRMRQGE